MPAQQPIGLNPGIPLPGHAHHGPGRPRDNQRLRQPGKVNNVVLLVHLDKGDNVIKSTNRIISLMMEVIFIITGSDKSQMSEDFTLLSENAQ
jgi:hypothetical protein